MAASADSVFEETLQRLARSSRDEQAWATLFRHTWDYVRRAAEFHLGSGFSAGSAEDVAQDVFFQLARAAHVGSLRWPSNQAGCIALLQILTRNRALDVLRRVNRQRRDAHRDIHQVRLNEIPTTGPADNTTIDAEDFLQELGRRLDPFDRTILDFLLQERGPTEIADALGTSSKTIQRHLRVIRQIARRLHQASQDGLAREGPETVSKPKKDEKNVPGGE